MLTLIANQLSDHPLVSSGARLTLLRDFAMPDSGARQGGAYWAPAVIRRANIDQHKKTGSGLSAHASAHHGDASVAVRRALQRYRAVARPREHQHHSPLRRGRPRDEEEGARQAGSTYHEHTTIPRVGCAHTVLADSVTM
jgi:hypothetical protein